MRFFCLLLNILFTFCLYFCDIYCCVYGFSIPLCLLCHFLCVPVHSKMGFKILVRIRWHDTVIMDSPRFDVRAAMFLMPTLLQCSMQRRTFLTSIINKTSDSSSTITETSCLETILRHLETFVIKASVSAIERTAVLWKSFKNCCFLACVNLINNYSFLLISKYFNNERFLSYANLLTSKCFPACLRLNNLNFSHFY